jgi:BASS family bile acid:Na+ symporter
MNEQQIIALFTNVFLFVFVVSSMLSMGMSLTLQQILAQLRNVKIVGLAIAINFIVVPALAYGLSYAFNLDQDAKTGFILVGAAAGAPFLPKLSKLAKGNMAFSVGLMTLLMIVTIIYVPLVMPLMLQGVTVNAWEIAKPLLILMLLPLAIGLLVHSRWLELSKSLVPILSRASTFSVLLLFCLVLSTNIGNLMSLFGTYTIAGAIILTGVAFGLGYLVGGPQSGTRKVLGLGSGFRNLGAAFTIAATSFAGQATVSVVIIVFALVAMIILGAAAGEFVRRAKKQASRAAQITTSQAIATETYGKATSQSQISSLNRSA